MLPDTFAFSPCKRRYLCRCALTLRLKIDQQP
jgi:hypothetical protein